MSRIIVKQLPKNITEEKVRKVFEAKGKITDVQLKYTPDGKFRQFCFIGYQTPEDAQEAIRYFNNSCIQTSRIKVELCAALGSEEKPRSWSKYAKDSKVNEDKVKEEQKERELKEKAKDPEKLKKKLKKFDEIIGKHKDDPEFQEFLKLHDKNRVLWANDADIEGIEANLKAAKELAKAKQHKDDDDDVEEDEEEDEEEDGKDSGVVESEEDAETEKLAEKPISDLEYMNSLINKTSEPEKKEKPKEKQTKKDKEKDKKKVSSDLDLFTIKIHNIPYKVKRQEVIKFFKPIKPYSVRLPTSVHGFCYVGFKTEKEMSKAMLKNKSFIRGKQVFFSDFTEKNKITKSKKDGVEYTSDKQTSSNKPTNPKWEQQQESLRNEEDISESGKIFFRNLSYTVTEDDLRKVFEPFGPVAEISLPVDRNTRKIKGFGTVTFLMPEHAVQAFNKLDGTDFHGRLFHLIPGKSNDKDDDLNENQQNLSFQEKKELKIKKSAQQVGTWNTLFLGANTVAEVMAREFSTSKEQILDNQDGGSSAAVRLAMGETKIVVEMKKFLEDNHVCVNAFDVLNAKRSKTIILAKNLPADTTVEDLKPLFGQFGPIGRLVLPPSGVTAIIEFCDPSEARQAFRKLAFSKFKQVPLFLEWAPENTFSQSLTGERVVAEKLPAEPKPVIVKEEKKLSRKARLKAELEAAELAKAKEQEEAKAKEANDKGEEPANEAEEEDEEPPEPNTTLFLRNLNFKTVPETIYKHFQNTGAIYHVEIAKRRDPKDPRFNESLGYGFIQFKKASVADKVLKNMQMTQIDGNQVELKRSDRILKSHVQAQSTLRKKTNLAKQTGTKILVKNIPFQAQTNEVRDIFKIFGELRTVRLPKKMTPGEDAHRGFGFVDFISKTDARKAFEALSQSTHLYGRRLVLEWASTTEDEVDEIRKRTAENFDGGLSNASKSQKRLRSEIVTEMEKVQKKNKQGDDDDDMDN